MNTARARSPAASRHHLNTKIETTNGPIVLLLLLHLASSLEIRMDVGMDVLLSGALDPTSLAALAASGGSPMDLSSILSALSPSGDAMNFLSTMNSSGVLAGTGFDPSTFLASLNTGGTGTSTWSDPATIMNMVNPASYTSQAPFQMGGVSSPSQDSTSGSSLMSNVGQDMVQDLVKKAAQYALDKLKSHRQQGQPAQLQYTSTPMQYTPAPLPTFTQHAQAPFMPFNAGPGLPDLPSYTQPGQPYGQGFAQSPPAQQYFPQSASPMQYPVSQSSPLYTPQPDFSYPANSSHTPQHSWHSSQSPPYHNHLPSYGSGNSPPSANSWSSHVPDISVSFEVPNNSGSHSAPSPSHSSTQTVHQAPQPGSHSPRPSLSEWRPPSSHSAHHAPSRDGSHSVSGASNIHHTVSHSSSTLHSRPPSHPASKPLRPHAHSVSVSVVHSHSHPAPHQPLPPLLPNRPSHSQSTAHHAHTGSSSYSSIDHSTSTSSSDLPSGPASSHKPVAQHSHTAPMSFSHLELALAPVSVSPPHKPALHHAHTLPAPKIHAHSRPSSMYGSHVGGTHAAYGHTRTDSTPNAHRQGYASDPPKGGVSQSTRPSIPEPMAGGMSRGQSLYASAMADLARAKEESG